MGVMSPTPINRKEASSSRTSGRRMKNQDTCGIYDWVKETASKGEEAPSKSDRRHVPSKTRNLDDDDDSPSRDPSMSRRGRRLDGLQRSSSRLAVLENALEVSKCYKEAYEGAKKQKENNDEMKKKLNRSIARGASMRDIKKSAAAESQSSGLRRIQSSEELAYTERREKRRKGSKPSSSDLTLRLPPKSKSTSSSSRTRSRSRKRSDGESGVVGRDLQVLSPRTAVSPTRNSTGSLDRNLVMQRMNQRSKVPSDRTEKRRNNRRLLTGSSRSMSMSKLQMPETSTEGPAWWGALVDDTKPEEKDPKSSSQSRPKLDGKETKEHKMPPAPRPRLPTGRREQYSKSCSQPNLMAGLEDEESDAPYLWQKLITDDESSDHGKPASKSSRSTRTSSPDQRRSSTGTLDLRNSSDSIDKESGRKHGKKHLDLPSSYEHGRSRSRGGKRSSLAKLASLKDEGEKRNSDDAVTLPPSLDHSRSKAKPARRSSLTHLSSSNESPDSAEERQAKSSLPDHGGRSRASHQSLLVKNLRSTRGQEHARAAQHDPDDDEDSTPEDKPKHEYMSHRLPSSSPCVISSSSLERPTVQANNGMFCPPQLQKNAIDRRATFGRPSLGRPSYSERKLSGLEPSEKKPLRRPASTDGLMDLMDDDGEDDDSFVCSRSRRGTAINFGSGGIVIPDVAGPNANFGKDREKISVSKKMLSALSFGVTGRNLMTEKDRPVEPSPSPRPTNMLRRENSLKMRHLQVEGLGRGSSHSPGIRRGNKGSFSVASGDGSSGHFSDLNDSFEA